MARDKHPLCDCPSDATLGRIRALRRRVARAKWWGRTIELQLLASDAEAAERRMYIRRCGCRWHDPGLRRIYLKARASGGR